MERIKSRPSRQESSCQTEFVNSKNEFVQSSKSKAKQIKNFKRKLKFLCTMENQPTPKINLFSPTLNLKKISTFSKKITANLAINYKMAKHFLLLLGLLSLPHLSSEQQIQNQQQPSFRTPPLFNQFQQATGSPISHKQLQHIVF